MDGAIHRAAGPELVAECRTLGGCRTGEAKITRGDGLPARRVIHTVGPVCHGGGRREVEALTSCHANSLRIAATSGLGTLALPAISTGVYGYPVEQAARVAVEATWDALQRAPASTLSLIVLCTFDAAATEVEKDARVALDVGFE